MPMPARLPPLLLGLALAACGTPTPDRNDDTTGTPDAGTTDTPDAGSSGTPDTSTSAITGTLGTLGPAKPIASSLYIWNGSETIVYLSTEQLNCSKIQGIDGSRWLGTLSTSAQVVELVISGKASTKTYAVPPEEFNYAQGGKSSSYEKHASSGSIKFTKAEDQVLVEGTFSATISGSQVTGTFHAPFCVDGQEF